MSTTYQDAGVNIEAGNSLVEKIKPLAKNTKRKGADTDLGGFGGLFDLAACKYKDPILVSGTDGVGTKLKLAFALDKHDTIGIDLVAMCSNDIIVQGAEPLFFLDYLATSKLDENTAENIIKGISEGCKQSNAALIGGETAEMPGMYEDKHYDLAGFCVGAVEREEILPKKNITNGDVILGLSSSGIHSNGYSLVRHILEKKNIDYKDKADFDNSNTIGEILLTPTKIYVKSILAALDKHKNNIKGLAHITGGGFLENIPRVLPSELAANIDIDSFAIPPVFSWLKELGEVADLEMLKTFNCGIGMIIIAEEKSANDINDLINKEGIDKCQIIGQITKSDKEQVIFKNNKTWQS